MSDLKADDTKRLQGVLTIQLLADRANLKQWPGGVNEPTRQTAVLYHGDVPVCHVYMLWPAGIPPFGVIHFAQDGEAGTRHGGEHD